jgi:hypothetical protein
MSLLIYADDTAVLAESEADLQQLLTCVEGWCTGHGMTISTIKSEVVVFNCKWRDAVQVSVHVQGTRLPVSKSFKYLGVWFHHSKGTAHMYPRLLAGGSWPLRV